MPSQKQKALSSRIKKLLIQKILQNHVDHEVQICMLIFRAPAKLPRPSWGAHPKGVTSKKSHVPAPKHDGGAVRGALATMCTDTGLVLPRVLSSESNADTALLLGCPSRPTPRSETPTEGPEITTPVRQNPSQNRNKQQLFRNKR